MTLYTDLIYSNNLVFAAVYCQYEPLVRCDINPKSAKRSINRGSILCEVHMFYSQPLTSN
jgi:hypothetical protein